jgi:hypothetical protein
MMRIHDKSRSDWGDAWNIAVARPPNHVGDGVTAVRYRLAMMVCLAILISSGEGCSSVFRERMCSPGEHAVRAIEAPDTGRTCVKNGQPPPPRYEEFPPGQRPTYVDQDR